MMTCERTRALLSLYVLGDLKPDATAAIAEHVASCADCRQEYERIQSTVSRLQDALAESGDAPPRLSEERRRQVLATLPGGLLARRPAAPRPEFWLVRHHRGLALAAGLLVVIGLLWSALDPRERLAGRTGRLSIARPETAARCIDVDICEPEEAVNGPYLSSGDYIAGAYAEKDVHRLSADPKPDSESTLNIQHSTPNAQHPTPNIQERNPDLEVGGLVADAGRSDALKTATLSATRRIAGDEPTSQVGWTAVDEDGDKICTVKLPDPVEMTFSPAPAEFDDIAITRSPVLMKGLYSSRAPGGGKEHERREPAPDEIVHAPLLQTRVSGYTLAEPKDQSIDGEAESPPPSMTESPVNSDGIPLLGRLFTDRPVSGSELGSDHALDSKDILPAAAAPPPEKKEAKLLAGTGTARGTATFYRFLPKAAETGVKKESEAAAAAGGGSTPARTVPSEVAQKPDGEAKQGWKEDANGEMLRKPRTRAYGVNPFVKTTVDPLSTFAIDVDTASYTIARRYMHQGALPPAELVRTEEFVNAFDYAYRAPTHETFRIYTELAPSPFGTGLHLLKIGVKGRRLGREEERPAVLTLVIDTSGSMNQPDRLDLVQAALHLLIDQLGPRDRVAVIQYDSHARIALEPTPVTRKADILAVIDGLQCHGSTNLEEAMQQAYALAVRAFVPGAENRVILMSDGVANMGADSAKAILGKVETNRRQGITCSVMGFGMGSYDDAMLESLANKGDGVYTFIDSLDQARRVFVDDLAATLNTIARDVKIQVQFNPAWVVQHRQLGYENRQLAHRDFRNDAIDAGEVGSGQSVTALYECELPPAAQARDAGAADVNRPVATVSVRYRRVDTGAVEEIRHDVYPRDVQRSADDLPAEFRLAACVAEFAEILRGSPFAIGSDFESVAKLLRPVALELHLDTRVQELLRLVHAAGSLGTAE